MKRLIYPLNGNKDNHKKDDRMDNIEKVFKRAEVQNLREFFSCGTDCEETVCKPYNERIKSAERRLERELRKRIPDDKEFDEALSVIYECAGEAEEAYMEIGIVCGARLILNLLKQ